MIMGSHEKPIATSFSGETINTFALCLKSEDTKIPTLFPLLNFVLEILSNKIANSNNNMYKI